jgi:asparagine synthase (glutamine-hydrolysing)
MVKDKVDKLRALLSCRSYNDLYRQAVSDTADPSRFFSAPVQGFMEETASCGQADAVLRGCLSDIDFYLPNDILVKVDRASMSCGLEARSPFLDHRLLECALSLPTELKVSKGGGKAILKDLLSQYVPSELFQRPKMGFAVPLDQWLREDLKGWAEELFSSPWLTSGDLLDPQAVKALWLEHQSGERRRHHLLWNILMLLAWLEENE